MASAHPLRSALAALLFVAAAVPVEALQLGDTKAHLLARHGTPRAEDVANKQATYSWAGWSAHVTFRDGLVELLAYQKNAPIQQNEIASLLLSNGGGANRWREIGQGGA